MASLTDLPPELLAHITSYLPTASAVSSLSRSNKSLKQVVDKDGWATFNRSRFPSLQVPHPHDAACRSYQRDVAGTLVALSRAWDRRAFAARYTEPIGDIRGFPGGNRVEKWKRPRGQTIGFTPQLDSYEIVGQSWSDRKELLAFSAGAEICVRERKTGRRSERLHQDSRWVTYRPTGAAEGKDDVTALHLIRPAEKEDVEDIQLLYGTANGFLGRQRLSFAAKDDTATDIDHRESYHTEGLPVRSASFLERTSSSSLLAAALGETRISVYTLDDTREFNEAPASQIDIPIPADAARTYRTWSTNFISPSSLAVGLGPSESPIHIYTILPTGLDKDVVRKFTLQTQFERLASEKTSSGFAKKLASSIYPIVPLPTSANSSGDGSIFLSGAYDGVARLHDLRSDRDVEGEYVGPTDDSAIYSLLPRGREKLVVGTSRHSLLKVFDMRMGAKCYSYRSASQNEQDSRDIERVEDWNLFLKPQNATYPGRGGGNNWARRSAESSVYSLTSPSPTSPFIYAGVEDAVVELAFSELFDPRPDPAFFESNSRAFNTRLPKKHGHLENKDTAVGDVLNLAMYEQCATRMELMSQRNVREMMLLQQTINEKGRKAPGIRLIDGLDDRWRPGDRADHGS